MADIDDAVELARRCLDVGGADYNECDLNALARAVLGMMAEVARLQPVVEAARAWGAVQCECATGELEPTATALAKALVALEAGRG